MNNETQALIDLLWADCAIGRLLPSEESRQSHLLEKVNIESALPHRMAARSSLLMPGSWKSEAHSIRFVPKAW